MTWTQDTALKQIQVLIQGIDRVCSAGRHSADHTHWVLNAVSLLSEVFGRHSKYYLTFTGLRWSETSGFVIQSSNIQDAIDRRNELAFERDLAIARGTLEAAHEHLERSGINAVYEGKDTAPESSAIVKVINLVERKLRKVIRSIPADEREVQEAFETLLIGADIPYSRETVALEYSSKTYRPDFSIERLDLAIEVKLCARPGREKEMIAEINDDILAYQTKYGNILFVVYDIGQIRDGERFATPFESCDKVIVRIVKH